MKVRLVAGTFPSVYQTKAQNGEELIVYVARVSNPSNQSNMETAPKLLRYLIKNAHWSPFEHAFMTVEIVTSRGIAAQILRHRSFSFQEFSQRYAEAAKNERYEARRQDAKNRQNSIDDMTSEERMWFLDAQDEIWLSSYRLYLAAINRGIAKEQARFLLPLSTQTTLYMTGSVRSWLHYIDLRQKPGTQKEHRDIVLEIKKVFTLEYPNIAAAMWGDDETKNQD